MESVEVCVAQTADRSCDSVFVCVCVSVCECVVLFVRACIQVCFWLEQQIVPVCA